MGPSPKKAHKKKRDTEQRRRHHQQHHQQQQQQQQPVRVTPPRQQSPRSSQPGRKQQRPTVPDRNRKDEPSSDSSSSSFYMDESDDDGDFDSGHPSFYSETGNDASSVTSSHHRLRQPSSSSTARRQRQSQQTKVFALSSQFLRSTMERGIRACQGDAPIPPIDIVSHPADAPSASTSASASHGIRHAANNAQHGQSGAPNFVTTTLALSPSKPNNSNSSSVSDYGMADLQAAHAIHSTFMASIKGNAAYTQRHQLQEYTDTLARILYWIGRSHYRQEEYAQSIRYYQDALELYEATVGRYHGHTLRTYHATGLSYQAMGNMEHAVVMFRVSARIQQYLFGLLAMSPSIATLGLDETSESYLHALLSFNGTPTSPSAIPPSPPFASSKLPAGGVRQSTSDWISDHRRDMAKSLRYEKTGDKYRRDGNIQAAIVEYEKAVVFEDATFGCWNVNLCFLWRKLSCLLCIRNPDALDDTDIDVLTIELDRISHAWSYEIQSLMWEDSFHFLSSGDKYYNHQQYEEATANYKRAGMMHNKPKKMLTSSSGNRKSGSHKTSASSTTKTNRKTSSSSSKASSHRRSSTNKSKQRAADTGSRGTRGDDVPEKTASRQEKEPAARHNEAPETPSSSRSKTKSSSRASKKVADGEPSSVSSSLHRSSSRHKSTSSKKIKPKLTVSTKSTAGPTADHRSSASGNDNTAAAIGYNESSDSLLSQPSYTRPGMLSPIGETGDTSAANSSTKTSTKPSNIDPSPASSSQQRDLEHRNQSQASYRQADHGVIVSQHKNHILVEPDPSILQGLNIDGMDDFPTSDGGSWILPARPVD